MFTVSGRSDCETKIPGEFNHAISASAIGTSHMRLVFFSIQTDQSIEIKSYKKSLSVHSVSKSKGQLHH